MRDRMYWRKKTATLGIAAALAAGCAAGGLSTTAWATSASCVADNIVVRESAVNGAQVGGLSQGQEVTIVDETTGSDGNTWYQITYEVNGSERTGWVRGDLITGETASADSEETADADDTEGTADETVSGETASLVFTTQSGTVTLTIIPDEELALVSDRYTETALEFAEGTINALQLLEPDELVADDAAIVDFYYVYGQNEIGETGWYVYNIEDGSLQKNLLNMSYSIPIVEETDADAELSLDSTVRMIGSALAVICLLLLVLVIIFSVRYRRLRRLYEEETDGEWVMRDAQGTGQTDTAAEPEAKKKKRRGEPIVEEAPVQEESAESEIKGVSVLNLDLMEGEDYEALLNQYLDETEEKVTDEIPAAAQESIVEVSEDTVSASESAEEAAAEEMKETPQETAAADEDEPEFYDDDDEDLEFL
ncbi:MAG: SH3 domain-containing protein [Clostridiales bacterium]|nr:SH3 domain-containing protein [Clostridiales bacterium]